MPVEDDKLPGLPPIRVVGEAAVHHQAPKILSDGPTVRPGRADRRRDPPCHSRRCPVLMAQLHLAGTKDLAHEVRAVVWLNARYCRFQCRVACFQACPSEGMRSQSTSVAECDDSTRHPDSAERTSAPAHTRPS